MTLQIERSAAPHDAVDIASAKGTAMVHPPSTAHQTHDADHSCAHHPCCPTAEAPDRDAARVVTSHPEQGWSLLCNGVVSFDDAGDLLPGLRSFMLVGHHSTTVTATVYRKQLRPVIEGGAD